MRRLRLASCLLALGAAPAPEPGRDLRDAELGEATQRATSRDAAARALARQAELRRLAEARIEAASRLGAAEENALAAAGRVEELASRRAAADRLLAERAAALVPLLPLAARLSLYPAETLLAVPASAEAALHGMLVLRGLGRQVEQDAAAIRAEQAEVERLAGEMAAELARLRAAQASQQAQAAALDRQIAAGRELGRRLDDTAREEAERAAASAARTRTLRDALAKLEADRDRAEADRDRAEARARAAAKTRERGEALQASRGRRVAPAEPQPSSPVVAQAPDAMRAPVAGTVVRGWGARTDAGPASGLLLRAAPGARVVAPCSGGVAFAGPFRSFGLLVILDCSGGIHVVMSGLDRLDAAVGDKVRAGEPVGAMPGWDPQSPGTRPALYVELRRGGKAVDPAPFLRTRR